MESALRLMQFRAFQEWIPPQFYCSKELITLEQVQHFSGRKKKEES